MALPSADNAVQSGWQGAEWFSPIHPVTNGNSDSQNSRWRFAHRMLPVLRSIRWSMW